MSEPSRRVPDGPTPAGRTSALDRPVARVGAFLIFLSVAAVLAWIHRDDLFPPEPTISADDPVAKCLAERSVDIDKMRQDGVVDPDRAKLFKSRAEALCQAQFGAGAGPPPLPQ